MSDEQENIQENEQVSEEEHTPAWRTRGYWVRLIGVLAFGIVFALIAAPIVIAFLGVNFLTRPGCEFLTPIMPYSYTYEDITFESPLGYEVKGYYFPGTNGAVILVPPAYRGDKGGMLHEARYFIDAGYSVVTWDSRNCSGQVNTLGYLEVEDLRGALDWVLEKEGEGTPIGVHGFSSAGATALMAAARYDEIGAVIAEGSYGNYQRDALFRDQGMVWYARLNVEGQIVAYNMMTGQDIANLDPGGTIGELDIPVMLIYGDKETTLPGAKRMQEDGGDNVTLWIVGGASHGQYAQKSHTFPQAVVNFFDGALLEGQPSETEESTDTEQPDEEAEAG